MKKSQGKRTWTQEQKAEIVHKHLDEHVSVRSLEKEYNADRSMICKWVKRYIAEGESSFAPKKATRESLFSTAYQQKAI